MFSVAEFIFFFFQMFGNRLHFAKKTHTHAHNKKESVTALHFDVVVIVVKNVCNTILNQIVDVQTEEKKNKILFFH